MDMAITSEMRAPERKSFAAQSLGRSKVAWVSTADSTGREYWIDLDQYTGGAVPKGDNSL
jgi:hypothetical protein